MIAEEILRGLISENESEGIDFKASYSASINDHAHDILCLLNSSYDGDRYLIFGIKNKTKEVLGIENDPNLNIWQEHYFQDWLRKLDFNRKPDIKFFESEYNGRKLGIVFIKNRHDKPFFLRKTVGNAKAGVIYTRNGSTNTPHNETATDADIENMFRERFGINLGSIDRLYRLMDDYKNWARTEDGTTIHHVDHPEFHIKDNEDSTEFEENAYRKRMHIPSASKIDSIYKYQIYYFNTHIADVRLIFFDTGRITMPWFDLEFSDNFPDGYNLYISKESLDYKFYKIYMNLKTGLYYGFEHYGRAYIEEQNRFLFLPHNTDHVSK